MGGSEAAALSLALELAHQGHHVLMGAKVPYPTHGILSVCPVDMFPGAILAEAYDVLVSWDDVYLFRFALPHIPVKVICYQLNDTLVGVFSHVVDAYFHPSQWHADRFAEVYDVPKSRQYVGLTNGTAPLPVTETPRANQVVWASSPDRGLHHLLRVWPQVREQVNDAELHIYYDMDKWLSIVTTQMQQGRILCTTDRALEVKKRLVPLISGNMGVTYHGGVSRARVNTAMLQAKVLAYPCDPIAPTEGFSMTTLEGWAAGCQVLVTDADALQELWGHRDGITCLPLPIDDDLWVNQIVKGLQADAKPGRREVPEELTWPYIAHKWVEVFNELLNTDA
jgi:glycosyltransferase involved in cell wall biosynthesis